jgi:hypothetical protein
MGHSWRSTGPSDAAGRICSTLVTSEGSSSQAAACPVGMNSASSAMETVGRPRPTTPLTTPASANTSTAPSSSPGWASKSAFMRPPAVPPWLPWWPQQPSFQTEPLHHNMS